MILVHIKDASTNYILTGELNGDGDLVVSASDFSPSVKEGFGTDEYEYYYVVKAANVPLVRRSLGVGETEPFARSEMFARLRALLAPHGYTASTHYKAWLVDNKIPYDFSVWR